MTYQDQPYYKEYRDLLKELSGAISTLKADKKRLEEENRDLTGELRAVRSELTEATNLLDSLKSENEHLKTASPQTVATERQAEASASADFSGKGTGVAQSLSARDAGSNESPSLFSDLDENEKIILRQQIHDLISRIDHHLAGSGKA
ncbi:hypothetical protein QA596_00340 [Balneolales bacterium ANBcel1]|nr:hypothetical protein [Balneolales bacterium ANBcel1]